MSLKTDCSVSSTFYIPDFPIHLLLVKHVTKQLNCKVTLFPSYCVFQDLAFGMMIGGDHEVGGVYVLTQLLSLSTYALSASVLSIQWHYRLGHALASLFQYLDLPSVSSRPLECESCHLGKHHRVSFPTKVNKVSSTPFDLVHYDIWGPI